MHILLIEDDVSTARSIELALKVQHIHCTIAYTGYDGVEAASAEPFDIVLLDMLLPDCDGTDVIRMMRQRKIQTPILILSAVTQTDQKIKALQLGADDYMTKPFNSTELVARAKAIIKRANKDVRSIVHVGKISVDFDRHIVKICGKVIKMTDKEYSLIELLILRRAKYTTKDQIIQHLYGEIDMVEQASVTKAINVFLCRIRKKFETASGGLNFIQTVWESGYKIIEEGEAVSNRKTLFGRVDDKLKNP